MTPKLNRYWQPARKNSVLRVTISGFSLSHDSIPPLYPPTWTSLATIRDLVSCQLPLLPLLRTSSCTPEEQLTGPLAPEFRVRMRVLGSAHSSIGDGSAERWTLQIINIK